MPENNAIVAIMPINKDLFILSIDRLSNLVGLKAAKHYFLHRFIVKHMTNSTLQKQLFQTGAAFAGLAVVAGAFGSHAIVSFTITYAMARRPSQAPKLGAL